MITPSEIKELKSKIGNEMKRRCWYGNMNVSPYNDTDIANASSITKGSRVLATQANSVIEPMNKLVEDDSLQTAVTNEVIPETFTYTYINDKVTTWSN